MSFYPSVSGSRSLILLFENSFLLFHNQIIMLQFNPPVYVCTNFTFFRILLAFPFYFPLSHSSNLHFHSLSLSIFFMVSKKVLNKRKDSHRHRELHETEREKNMCSSSDWDGKLQWEFMAVHGRLWPRRGPLASDCTLGGRTWNISSL